MVIKNFKGRLFHGELVAGALGRRTLLLDDGHAVWAPEVLSQYQIIRVGGLEMKWLGQKDEIARNALARRAGDGFRSTRSR